MTIKSNVFLVVCAVIGVSLGGCEDVFDGDMNEDGSQSERAGTSQCVQVDEGGTATLSCPSGQVIASVDFASYGTPTGSCPNFSSSSCHAASSKSKVEAACLNKQSCTVGAYSCVSPNAAQCVQVNEGGTATLSCPSGQSIGSVAFASYGTPTGSCPNFSSSSCHASSSKSVVEAACLNKQSCSVGANNGVFGDPCGGTFKKLAVTYTCVSPNAALCAQGNEGSTAALSCPSGQVIKSIAFASYGTPTGSCPNFVASSCHASTSKSKVEAACLNKQSCNVGANNGVFGDPCVGTYKKLAIAYSCGVGGGDGVCNDAAGINGSAIDSYGSGAVRAQHKPISCGNGSTVERDNGPPNNRINLIIIGDGYTASELETTWKTHVSNALNVMFGPNTEPYRTYQKYINVCRINVASPQSGVDIAKGSWPPSSYTYTEYKNTAFDGVCNEENRLGTMDDQKVRQKLGEVLAGTGVDADWVGAVLNTNRWCNAGGAFANWAGATSPLDVAFHEAGHSWHGLADEYGGPGVYSGNEPSAVNVTKTYGAKWPEWQGFDQPVIGRIGWYEGGYYVTSGIYRPSNDSKMNWTGNPHNAICMQKMVRDIYALVRPIDAWTDNQLTLVNPCRIAIKLVDSSLVQVTWSIDGVKVDTTDKETLWLNTRTLSAGHHTVAVEVKDPTLYVRNDTTNLRQQIQWTVTIQ